MSSENVLSILPKNKYQQRVLFDTMLEPLDIILFRNVNCTEFKDISSCALIKTNIIYENKDSIDKSHFPHLAIYDSTIL